MLYILHMRLAYISLRSLPVWAILWFCDSIWMAIEVEGKKDTKEHKLQMKAQKRIFALFCPLQPKFFFSHNNHRENNKTSPVSSYRGNTRVTIVSLASLLIWWSHHCLVCHSHSFNLPTLPFPLVKPLFDLLRLPKWTESRQKERKRTTHPNFYHFVLHHSERIKAQGQS